MRLQTRQPSFRLVPRDVGRRGRDRASVVARYEQQVQPAYVRYLEPLKKQADLIVDGTAPIGRLAARVLVCLEKILTKPVRDRL